MQVYYGLHEFDRLPPTALTVGTYDGIHLGHQAILKVVRGVAAEQSLASAVLTFHPHPRLVVGRQPEDLALLTSLGEKVDKFSRMGIDYLVFADFTPEFAEQSYQQFVEQVIVGKMNAKELIVGFDHRFGRHRTGGLDQLVELGAKFDFKVTEIRPQLLDAAKISSTRIRNALHSGNISEANELLGEPYRLTGKVVHGDGVGGSRLGFPTANLVPDDAHKLLPQVGVYAVEAVTEADGTWPAMLNIGYRPTVDGKDLRIEANLIGFSGNLYGQTMSLRFVGRIRPEQRFASIDELIAQLHRDRESALQLLGTEAG